MSGERSRKKSFNDDDHQQTCHVCIIPILVTIHDIYICAAAAVICDFVRGTCVPQLATVRVREREKERCY